MSIRCFLLIICFFLAWEIKAEMLVVAGTVKDGSTNQPLKGVSVSIEKDARSTTTNHKGEYIISVLPGERLKFSLMNYETKTITVTGTKLNVRLKPLRINGFTPKIFECEEEIAFDTADPQACRAVSVGIGGSLYKTSRIYSPDLSQNTEEYGSFVENRFIPAKAEPLSTFSIDVDAASYSNMRRFINRGLLPPKDAIRTEELINYFTYDYPSPTGNDPVKITTEAGECPWNPAHRLVRIGLKAREIDREKLPPSNFVFLIDVSGSMDGPTRLDLVKSSLRLLINNLREKDKVAIVVYSGSAGEILPSTSGDNKEKLRDAVNQLEADGSTAGGEGILLAYKIARKNFLPEGNNRIILCTDGDFNVGVSSPEKLEKLIEKERKSGIYLTILGYGMGNYKDNKMQVLAEKGNGNHAYIDNLQEANKVLVNEFGSTMYAVAKDVKLQVEFNPAQVEAYRLIGYESRLLNKEDFNDDTKDAGEMGAGHTVTALYEVVPTGIKDYPGKVDELKYSKPSTPVKLTSSPELLTVKLRYKFPESDTSRKIEIPLIDKGNQQTSTDFRFVSAVAMFGQLIRDSDFKGEGSYEKVISLARQGVSSDEKGYRHEFIRLVETFQDLAK
nr:von Willebrand factor type A domain-containing protein [Parabacteroides pacaensis]